MKDHRAVRSRYSTATATATAISVALHAGMIGILVLVVSQVVDPSPTSSTRASNPPIAIDIVEPPPPPPRPTPGPAGIDVKPAARSTARPLGRRGHELARSIVRPVTLSDPYADLAINYETPEGRDADGPLGLTGTGIGHGLGGNGGGGAPIVAIPKPPPAESIVAIPEPPPAESLARGPWPLRDYSEKTIRGSRQYRGKTIVLDLQIDAKGIVRNVHLARGIERTVDLRAIAYALKFEFHPAVDAAGLPVAGTYSWQFVIRP